MFFRTIIALVLICTFPVFMQGQENTTNKVPSSENSKQEAQKENISYRKQKKAHEKEVKAHHKRLQTKEVRKRMKKDKRKAQLHNDKKKEFFLIRWFSPK